MAGSRIQEVFHKRLVLARLHHRHGKSLGLSFLSNIMIQLFEMFDFVQSVQLVPLVIIINIYSILIQYLRVRDLA